LRSSEAGPDRKRDVRNIFALSPLQEGMLFHALYEQALGAYHEQFTFEMRGELERSLFEAAWNDLVRRHECLRTVFLIKNVPQPLQLVLADRPLAVAFEDIRGLPSQERQPYVEAAARRDRERPFDLERGPLLRLALYRFADQGHYLILSFHHILMDGWSFAVLQREFLMAYEARLNERTLALPAAMPFSRYVKWLQARPRPVSLAYWESYLQGYAKSAGLPAAPGLAAPEAGLRRYEPAQEDVTLSADQTKALAALGARLGVTVNTIIQCLWGLLLGVYNDTRDVVFAATVSGRNADLPGIDSLVGLFINAIAVRIDARDDAEGPMTFSRLLKKVQDEAVSALEHHHVALADVQALSPLKQDLLNHILIFDNYPLAPAAETSLPFTASVLAFLEHTNYDFEVQALPGEQLKLTLKYNRVVHDPALVAQIAGHLANLIDTLCTREDLPLAGIAFLDPGERRRLITEYNRTSDDYDRSLTIIDLFEARAAEIPGAEALICQGRPMSYGELNAAANGIARVLKSDYGVRPEEPVALVMGRSEWMVAAIFGILKAGGAYVPIDPSYPEARVRYILANSCARTIVTEPALAEAGSWPPGMRLFPVRGDLKGENPPPAAGAGNLAYIIFTSGSTGDPKGVMIEHKNVVSFSRNLPRVFGMQPRDRLYALTTITFDISVLELIGTLLAGMSVVISSADVLEAPGGILAEMQASGTTVLQVTPSHLKALLEGRDPREALGYLRVLLIGGEPLPADLYDRLAPLFGRVALFNVYGPTETTIWSTAAQLDEKSGLTIGHPLLNESVYVLAADGTLAPEGVTGQIAIGGEGLARGYYLREDLTAERFVAIPALDGRRVYLTGDLGHWLPGGRLRCLGRNDEQVKVRGFRIEPAEIESRLKELPGIGQAVVLAAPTAEGMELQGYLLCDRDLDAAGLREALRERLPEYMIPTRFFPVDRIPLTPNGKVDRKALAQAGHLPLQAAVHFAPPRDDLERTIAGIWESVLNNAPVGILDNFFEIGGHSLTATRIVLRLARELQVELRLRDIFAHPTISDLAAAIRGKAAQVPDRIARAPQAPSYALAHGQERLWVMHHLQEGSGAYNMSFAIRIEGDLDVAALRGALRMLGERHEILRTMFVLQDGEPRQIVLPQAGIDLPLIDLSGRDDPEAAAAAAVKKLAAAPFALTAGPPLRAALYHLGQARHYLFGLVMHHIISDQWSMGVISRELRHFYRVLAGGIGDGLAPLRIQYKDYALWHNARLKSGASEAHRQYWHRQLGGELTSLELPLDYPRPAVRSLQGRTRRFHLGGALREKLADLGRSRGASVFMVLLAGLKILLYRYTMQEDIVVGTPAAGRDQADLEDQVGFFVNTLALRDTILGTDRLGEVLDRMRRTVTDAHEHQAYPFDLLVDELHLPRLLSRSPVFDVMVLYEEEEKEEFRDQGLVIRGFAIEEETAKFDLAFSFRDSAGSLALAVQYDRALFAEGTIDRLGAHYERLLSQMTRDTEALVSTIPMLTENEFAALTGKGRPLPPVRDVTIHGLFEEQVQKTPDQAALITDSRSMTYGELNKAANRLAHYLIRQQRPAGEAPTGLLTRRGPWAVIGLLGILKAGRTYLPLDVRFPDQRLRQLLADSGCQLVLAEEPLAGRIRELDPALTVLPIEEAVVGDGLSDPGLAVHPGHLAYVIYTSGSTGVPKGVMIEHRSFVNMPLEQIRAFGIGETDRVMQFAPLSFDASLSEIFMALYAGAALVPAPEEVIGNIRSFEDFILRQGITAVTLPPFYLAELDHRRLQGLRVLIMAGEPASVRDALRYAEAMACFNAYGPTEAAVCTSIHTVDPKRPYGASLPIGRPLLNTPVYILDEHLQPVPAGVSGEICIGGPGLARGYLNQPELTAGAFVPNPFLPGTRLYRSGDKGAWLAGGEIAYRGRKDAQVKIRGHRIEPAEVEQCLRGYGGVEEALVLAREVRGEKTLVAYVTGQGDLGAARLRARLSERLPEYMVPSHILRLASFPLTSSGKVDRSALPDPAPPSPARGREAYRPRDGVEEDLLALWCQVLGLEGPAAGDDFFALGGTSMAAVKLATRASEQFGLKVQIRDLYLNPTLEGFLGRLKELLLHPAGAAPGDRIDLHAECVLPEDIPAPPVRTFPAIAKPQHVLLTGATGFLGAHVLSELLQRTEARIHCLVRSQNADHAGRRVRESLEKYGLWDESLAERISAFPGDTSREGLGSESRHYHWLSDQVDIVYHIAARVDLVAPYAMLKPTNVGGALGLLRFAAQGKAKAINYVSSLSIFAVPEGVPACHALEQSALTLERPPRGGYAQSKWVAERLLEQACHQGQPVAFYRPGRITGRMETGTTNLQDFFCVLLKACIQMGIAPVDDRDREDMTPVDYAARALVHLSLRRESYGQVFHLVNASPISSARLVDLLRSFGYRIETMPYDPWRIKAVRSMETDPENALLPYLPLFAGAGGQDKAAVMHFDNTLTRQVLERSGIICPGVDEALVQRYLHYLIETGFLEKPPAG